jgi:type IV secretion system protein VirB6
MDSAPAGERMMVSCPIPSPGASFVRAMVAFVDCQAQSLGAGGYQALTSPGSPLALALTGLFTLFVALFGYRLLYGHAPDMRTGMFALVKVAIVLALATSWPAYRTLVYDVALRGPAELVADVGVPTGLPGAGGGLVERLDVADQALAALSVLGAGQPPPLDPASNQQASPFANPPPPFAGFEAFALGGSRLIFLLGAIGSIAAVRLIAGLMLALGPIFVAFLLFDNTRGLFEGWVRVLAGAALGAAATAVALGVELALLEPWLADILTRRSAGEALPTIPAELLLVTSVFALALLALLYAAARLAFGFRLAPIVHTAMTRAAAMIRAEERRVPAAAVAGAAAGAAEGRSRAAAVVDAVAAAQRREAAHAAPVMAFAAGAMASADGRRAAASGPSRNRAEAAAPEPLGRSFRRRTRSRVSASAGRRDGGR